MATHQATDILHLPSTPRARAYIPARNHFWSSFPEGRYKRLVTPGANLECAFYALRLSIAHQAPDLPVPELDTLRRIFKSMEERNAAVGLFNTDTFSADQLAMVFDAWGEEKDKKVQLGYVSEDGVPVLVNTARVTGADEGVVRVWVWNDGASLRGGIGHFEGVCVP